jgi:hypothetical protein
VAPNSDPQLIDLCPEEREVIEDIVEALHHIDTRTLPETPRTDTIRGLLWALEYLISPTIEPRCQHNDPFNIQLTPEEAGIGQAAIKEVWTISCSVLVGLGRLTTRGTVSRWGIECPATWSPGDFDNLIQAARESLARLEALIHQLKEADF